MWKKKKDPLLELLGYDSEQDFVTADDVLKEQMNRIMDGDLVLIVETAGLKTLSAAEIAGWSGIVKGHASRYVRRFFEKSFFTVDDVEEDADETKATIHLIGETVSGEELCRRALKTLAKHKDALQLFEGKPDMRKIGRAMDLINVEIAALTTAPVEGSITMEKQNGQWKLTDSDALSRVMIRGSLVELEQVMQNAFAKKLKIEN